jgi:hypothetical protein
MFGIVIGTDGCIIAVVDIGWNAFHVDGVQILIMNL